jgi:hypothetical protein
MGQNLGSLTGVAQQRIGNVEDWRTLVPVPQLGKALDTITTWQQQRGTESVESLVSKVVEDKVKQLAPVGELSQVLQRINWLY